MFGKKYHFTFYENVACNIGYVCGKTSFQLLTNVTKYSQIYRVKDQRYDYNWGYKTEIVF